MEVIRFIRGDAEKAVGGERLNDGIEKVAVHDAAPVMSPFRPRIRKAKIKHTDGPWRQEVSNCVGRFDQEDANVWQVAGLVTGAANAPGQPLNTQEIMLRLARGQSGEECAVTAAEVNLERRAPPEDRRDLQRFDVR